MNLPAAIGDPIHHYKQKIKTPQNKFAFQQINMSQLVKSLSKIKKSTSTSQRRHSLFIDQGCWQIIESPNT